LDRIAQRTRDRVPTSEYDIQQLMAGWFREEGLVTDSDPNVSAEENAGDPHYVPTASSSRAIHGDELVLLDLWGKLDRPGAVFADITWMAFTGRAVPERYVRAFAAVAAARDARNVVERSLERIGGATRDNWEALREEIGDALSTAELRVRELRPDAKPMGGTGPS
jgi:Xaa-Pro aminopeptidase